MEKVSKAIMRAFGAKPNGTDKTSCVNDKDHVKQIFALVATAFMVGAVTFGYKGLPEKMRAIEDKVLIIQSELKVIHTIDARLSRIENALIKK